MYRISNEQEKEIQSFISKLPDSMGRANVTNLFNEVWPTHRMTVGQLEKFLSFQNALPKDFQTYPQSLAHWLKNDEHTIKAEEGAGIPQKSQADLGGLVADSHAHIKAEKVSGDKGKQKQEILHTLGETDAKKAGTKADPNFELAVEKPKKETMKGNKTKSQAKEEEDIIARNREVSSTPKTKEKPKTVIVQKAQKRSAPKSRR